MSHQLSDDEQRMAWSGFFPPLTDERLQEIIERHAERTARFPGGDSWQVSWIAESLRAERATSDQLRYERDEARQALDDIDHYTYGWSYGLVSTVIDKIRLRARAVLAGSEPLPAREGETSNK